MFTKLLRRRDFAAVRNSTRLLIACGAAALSACSGDGGSLTSAETSTPTNETGAPGTCSTLSLGGTIAVSGNTFCIASPEANTEYALVPFNASTIASARSTFTVQPAGITLVASASGAAQAVLSTSSLESTGALLSLNGAEAFERALRNRERAALSSHAGGARGWFASRGASGGARLNIISASASVGDLVSLNSNAHDACSKANIRGARVMAVGRKALVVADTLNPTGGFTQAEYASIAATFDDVVDGINTKAFGEPSDVDQNGHVVLYFTSAVNALTPKDAGYYVGGFFYGRDLLPVSGTSSVGVCAASNVAEMFYLLVPDPTGIVNGNKFTRDFVSRATIATVAHEYEHLINASRRLYVNTAATDFEETWLDEGLAHMAEELLFYNRSGLSEGKNIDATLLRSNNTYRTAFNTDGISNFGRFRSFLANPSGNSPYASNDSLATRGATWAFLRYAIDQQSASQETVLGRLVNSTTTGLANLRAVFGSDLTPLFRDWTTAIVLDDVSGAALRYQVRSWNLSSILSTLDDNGVYPLRTQTLTAGTPTSVTIAGGGAAYLRFGVAQGATGTFNITAPPAIQATVVRLK